MVMRRMGAVTPPPVIVSVPPVPEPDTIPGTFDPVPELPTEPPPLTLPGQVLPSPKPPPPKGPGRGGQRP